jgi:hypothetical protein
MPQVGIVWGIDEQNLTLQIAGGVVEMQGETFSIYNSDFEHPTPVGIWFEEFFHLGQQFEVLDRRQRDGEIDSFPILFFVATPAIEFVTSAISIGFSWSRFENKQVDQIKKPLTIDEVSSLIGGEKLEVRARKSIWFVEFSHLENDIIVCNMQGSRKELRLGSTEIFRLPDWADEGNFDFNTTTHNLVNEWNAQRSPGIYIYGPQSLEIEFETKLGWAKYVEAGGKDVDSILDIARIDNSKNQFMHQINRFENHTQVDQNLQEVSDTIEPYPYIMLVGNQTVNKYFPKLKHRFLFQSNKSPQNIIAITEFGKTNQQKLAFDAIKSDINQLREISIENELELKVPNGCYVWAWTRQ